MTRAVGGEVHAGYQYFIFCLSERSDSLSQWRAYGSGGSGYSLGFGSTELSRERTDGEFSLVWLIYDEVQQKSLVDAGVQEARKFFSRLFPLNPPRNAQAGILRLSSCERDSLALLSSHSIALQAPEF